MWESWAARRVALQLAVLLSVGFSLGVVTSRQHDPSPSVGVGVTTGVATIPGLAETRIARPTYASVDNKLVSGFAMQTDTVHHEEGEGVHHAHKLATDAPLRPRRDPNAVFVAIGGGSTTYRVRLGIEQLPVLTFLAQGVLNTASPGYYYVLYIAHDYNDRIYSVPENREKLRETLGKMAASRPDIDLQITFVSCEHTGKPSWAHNDAMTAAFFDGAEYFYRINDDTRMTTPGWTEGFINTLVKMKPTNVGVVGPSFSEGHTGILTHDFVHRTHFFIFDGMYYPRDLPAWYSDEWMTKVYDHHGRMVKVKDISVKHDMKFGTRYDPRSKDKGIMDRLIASSVIVLEAWIQSHPEGLTLEDEARFMEAMETAAPSPSPSPSPAPPTAAPAVGEKKVVSISLYGSDPRYTTGAVRNAELVSTVFPGWTLRCYHDNTVPQEIMDKLRDLGVELVERDPELPGMFWRFQVASDPTVDRYIVRDSDSRLTAREKAAVDEWVASGKAWHVMRDHPSHSNYAMSGGLWGATHAAIPDMVDRLKAAEGYRTGGYMEDMNFLNKHIWPIAKEDVFAHDAFSCTKWGGGHPFPTPREGNEHVGAVYDVHDRRRAGDDAIIARKLPEPEPCRTPPSPGSAQ